MRYLFALFNCIWITVTSISSGDLYFRGQSKGRPDRNRAPAARIVAGDNAVVVHIEHEVRGTRIRRQGPPIIT